MKSTILVFFCHQHNNNLKGLFIICVCLTKTLCSPSFILICILIFRSKYLLLCEVVTANCIALCIKPHKRYFITMTSKYFGSLTFFSCVQIVSVVYSNRISLAKLRASQIASNPNKRCAPPRRSQFVIIAAASKLREQNKSCKKEE